MGEEKGQTVVGKGEIQQEGGRGNKLRRRGKRLRGRRGTDSMRSNGTESRRSNGTESRRRGLHRKEKR